MLDSSQYGAYDHPFKLDLLNCVTPHVPCDLVDGGRPLCSERKDHQDALQ